MCGKHHVQDQQVRLLLARHAVSGLSVGGCEHIVTLHPEAVVQAAKNGRVVLDDQYQAHD
jgi:hypothetical protein